MPFYTSGQSVHGLSRLRPLRSACATRLVTQLRTGGDGRIYLST